MNRAPDIEVLFAFNGTRKNPAADGYRPHHLVMDGCLTTGIHHYYDAKYIAPNGTVKGTITFISPEAYPNCLWIGKKISIQEGERIVGCATILNIFNPILTHPLPYEHAVYYKLLLLCGYTDKLQSFVDQSLLAQDPIADIVLDLAFAGTDNNKLLSVLNEYLLDIDEAHIDYNGTVFSLVLDFLRRKYYGDRMPVPTLTKLMYDLAKHTDRYLDDPWYSMYLMDDLLTDAERGYLDKFRFMEQLEAFINEGTCI